MPHRRVTVLTKFCSNFKLHHFYFITPVGINPFKNEVSTLLVNCKLEYENTKVPCWNRCFFFVVVTAMLQIDMVYLVAENLIESQKY